MMQFRPTLHEITPHRYYIEKKATEKQSQCADSKYFSIYPLYFMFPLTTLTSHVEIFFSQFRLRRVLGSLSSSTQQLHKLTFKRYS